MILLRVLKIWQFYKWMNNQDTKNVFNSLKRCWIHSVGNSPLHNKLFSFFLRDLFIIKTRRVNISFMASVCYISEWKSDKQEWPARYISRLRRAQVSGISLMHFPVESSSARTGISARVWRRIQIFLHSLQRLYLQTLIN